MGKYNLKVPRSRGFQFKPESESLPSSINSSSELNDLFLFIFFARFAFKNGDVIENDTLFNKETNEIELDIPDEYLTLIEDVTLGPKAVRYIQWLIKSSQLWKIGSDGQLVPKDPDNVVSMNQLEIDQVAFFDEVVSNTSAANVTIDWNSGLKQELTLTSNVNLSFIPPPNPTSMQLIIRQTGSFVITWPVGLVYTGNIGNTTIAGRRDIASILYDGTDFYLTLARNFRV